MSPRDNPFRNRRAANEPPRTVNNQGLLRRRPCWTCTGGVSEYRPPGMHDRSRQRRPSSRLAIPSAWTRCHAASVRVLERCRWTNSIFRVLLNDSSVAWSRCTGPGVSTAPRLELQRPFVVRAVGGPVAGSGSAGLGLAAWKHSSTCHRDPAAPRPGPRGVQRRTHAGHPADHRRPSAP